MASREAADCACQTVKQACGAPVALSLHGSGRLSVEQLHAAAQATLAATPLQLPQDDDSSVGALLRAVRAQPDPRAAVTTALVAVLHVPTRPRLAFPAGRPARKGAPSSGASPAVSPRAAAPAPATAAAEGAAPVDSAVESGKGGAGGTAPALGAKRKAADSEEQLPDGSNYLDPYPSVRSLMDQLRRVFREGVCGERGRREPRQEGARPGARTTQEPPQCSPALNPPQPPAPTLNPPAGRAPATTPRRRWRCCMSTRCAWRRGSTLKRLAPPAPTASSGRPSPVRAPGWGSGSACRGRVVEGPCCRGGVASPHLTLPCSSAGPHACPGRHHSRSLRPAAQQGGRPAGAGQRQEPQQAAGPPGGQRCPAQHPAGDGAG